MLFMFNKNKTYEQHDNEKISFYRSSIEDLNSQDSLSSTADVDICVIGGGLTGISSALNLSNRGFSVALCEASHNATENPLLLRLRALEIPVKPPPITQISTSAVELKLS